METGQNFEPNVDENVVGEGSIPVVHRTVRYQAATAMVLNIVQIICGGIMGLLAGLSFVSISADAMPLSSVTYGCLYLIAGVTGLLAAKYKTYGFIIPNLALSVLATIWAAYAILYYAAQIITATTVHQDVPGLVIALVVISFIVAVVEITAAIWVSVLSGNIVCPCRGTDRGGEGKVYSGYRQRLSCGFGIAQIVLSVLLLIVALVQSGVAANYPWIPKDSLTYMSTAFSISSFVLILPAGILGIISALFRTLPVIIAHLVLCVLSSISVGGFITSAPAIIASSQAQKSNRPTADQDYFWNTNIALNVILLLICISEFIIAIWGSSLACRVTCCGAVDSVPPRVYLTHNKMVGLVLGSIQIAFGILDLILVAVVSPYLFLIFATAFGLWGGAIFIVTGSFGIHAARTKVRSKVMTHWILSLVTVLFAWAQFSFGMKMVWGGSRNTRGAVFAVGIVQILIAIAEIVVAVFVSIFAFRSTRDDAFRTRNVMWKEQQLIQSQP